MDDDALIIDRSPLPQGIEDSTVGTTTNLLVEHGPRTGWIRPDLPTS